MRPRRHIEIGHLPTHAFGPRMTMWWGTLAFIVLEGTAFAIAIAAYLYLAYLNQDWPLSAAPPDLLFGSIQTLILLASVVPNHFTKQWARNELLPKVQLGLVIMSLVGLASLIVRAFELWHLNVVWDENAYGSLVWLLIGLHVAHLMTDWGDTLVLTAVMFTRHAHGKRFSDVEDNAVYWDFVVLAWLPMYLLIYWFPRW